MTKFEDDLHMRRALYLAHLAVKEGEEPFGCVIIDNDGLGSEIGAGYGTGSNLDPTHHSEFQAIRQACKKLGGLLQGCTLYSTHEPCAMCCGAINHAKLSRVVFGSYRTDLPERFRLYNRGVYDRLEDTSHPPEVVAGVLNKECVALFGEVVKDERCQKCETVLHQIPQGGCGENTCPLEDETFEQYEDRRERVGIG